VTRRQSEPMPIVDAQIHLWTKGTTLPPTARSLI
jgi:hypothetical protein